MAIEIVACPCEKFTIIYPSHILVLEIGNQRRFRAVLQQTKWNRTTWAKKQRSSATARLRRWGFSAWPLSRVLRPMAHLKEKNSRWFLILVCHQYKDLLLPSIYSNHGMQSVEQNASLPLGLQPAAVRFRGSVLIFSAPAACRRMTRGACHCRQWRPCSKDAYIFLFKQKVELQDVSMRHISAIAQAFLNGLHFSNKSWWEAFFVGYLPHV